MRILLDTNIVVLQSRHQNFKNHLLENYSVSLDGDELFLPVVVFGELDSLVKQYKIGVRRQRLMQELIELATILPIRQQTIIETYGTLDAFSQGKLKSVPFTARNMGKNDLWIAATATAYELPLVTTDADFNHLNGTFLDLRYVDLNQFEY